MFADCPPAPRAQPRLPLPPSTPVLVCEANREAWDWCARWPSWPVGTLLVVYGAAGAGVSTLGRAWQARAQAATIDPLAPPATATAWLWIDNADTIPRAAWLQTLIDSVMARNGGMMLGAHRPIAQWPSVRQSPDLRSRLAAAHTVALHPLNDTTLMDALLWVARGYGSTLTPSVLRYLVPRVDRSWAGIHRAMHRIHTASQTESGPLNLALVQRALAQPDTTATPPPT